MEALSAAQDDSSGANPSSIKSDDSSPRPDSRTGSPPPNCAICLGTCKNKSFTDSCLHQFCFSCLLTWSKVKAECPLCKQAFRSIIHNVRSNHQYEEYLVVQRQTEESSSRIDIDRVTAATHRFRYRTTLTLPRRETIAIQQLLRHYPFMADVFPPPAPRAPPARRRRSPASFRRTVYRHNLWARPLPDFTGRFRDCSPEFYRYNDTQIHRLVPWINRELHYLLNENIGHISYVMSRILELLPQHHINSPEFREGVHRYFGDRTEHFLHELYCFASTPYDMTGYDRNVQYTTDSRISTMVNEVISSSDSEASVDSDIVMVSSSEPAEPPPGPSGFLAPTYPHNYISPATNNTVIPIETISQSDTDDDSSEVMLVGYIKPPQERTPEIVDLLGSDSDVIVQDNPQPEPVQDTESQESRPVPSVKLTLKRHRSRSSGVDESYSETDSDASYRPPPPRRRRARPSLGSSAAAASRGSSAVSSSPRASSAVASSPRASSAVASSPRGSSAVASSSRGSSAAASASRGSSAVASASRGSSAAASDAPTASDAGSTPERSAAPDALELHASTSSTWSPLSSSSTTSSDKISFNVVVKKRSKKKSSKETTSGRDRRKSKKRSSRSHHKEKKNVQISEKDKRSKRKSYSGKGVKSSNKASNSEWSSVPPEQTLSALDQPSTSGTSSGDRRAASQERTRQRRRDKRESRRLRSVVNVMRNSNKNTDESNSSANYSNLSNVTTTTSNNSRSDNESTPGTSNSRVAKTKPSGELGEIPTTSRGQIDTTSDSEDDLPLNLTLQKISPFSSS